MFGFFLKTRFSYAKVLEEFTCVGVFIHLRFVMSFFEESDGIDWTVLFLEEAIERQSSELTQAKKRIKMLEIQHYKEIERVSRRSSRELQLVASNHRGKIENLINLVAIQRAYIEKLEAELDQSNYSRKELEKQNEENESQYTRKLLLAQKKLEVVEDLIENREEQNENLNRRVDLEAKRLETIIEQQMEKICELKASESLLCDEVGWK